MANKVCPQRIIAEAIRLIELIPITEGRDEESITNNLQELESLSRALYRDGIINIVEAPIE